MSTADIVNCVFTRLFKAHKTPKMSFKPQTSYDPEQKIWTGTSITRKNFAEDLSIGEIIFQEMRRHPNLVAQVSATEHTVLTRKQLLHNTMRIATYMRHLELRQTDIVGIMARNTTHLAAVAYACSFNGIAFHPLNMGYSPETIEKLYHITKPRIIFCDGDEYQKMLSAVKDLDVKIITMRNHPLGAISIDEVLTTPIEKDFLPAQLEQGINQTLAILCSTGTTGMPKPVSITNSHVILNIPELLTIDIDDVQYSYSSIDWLSGFIALITSGVFSTKRIIIDCPFDPALTLHIIEEYKITWVLQVPTHMAMVANCPEFEQANLGSVRYLLYGGSRCSVQVENAFARRMRPNSLSFIYGITEIGSIATINLHFNVKPNSAGRLLPNFKVKILSEQGELLGPNERGEVCLFTGQYWGGYFDNPGATREIRDSQMWFHTGDMGYMDDDNFLYIVGRKKDMLKYQNIIYYPSEIEKVIEQIPDVIEACVFGIPNPIYGDEAAAAIVKRPGTDLQAQDVVDYVAQHVKAKYKQLNGGAIIMDEFLCSPNGKLSRLDNKMNFLKFKNNSQN